MVRSRPSVSSLYLGRDYRVDHHNEHRVLLRLRHSSEMHAREIALLLPQGWEFRRAGDETATKEDEWRWHDPRRGRKRRPGCHDSRATLLQIPTSVDTGSGRRHRFRVHGGIAGNCSAFCHAPRTFHSRWLPRCRLVSNGARRQKSIREN